MDRIEIQAVYNPIQYPMKNQTHCRKVHAIKF